MTQFTPVAALVGGILIGMAAVVLLWFNGRIAGVSGISGGLLFSARGERAWRVMFILGMVGGAALWALCHPEVTLVREQFPRLALLVGGLLVGYGTSMAGGCTSGHGVCGVARLSRRSLVATGVFLTVAIGVSGVIRHLLPGVGL